MATTAGIEELVTELCTAYAMFRPANGRQRKNELSCSCWLANRASRVHERAPIRADKPSDGNVATASAPLTSS